MGSTGSKLISLDFGPTWDVLTVLSSVITLRVHRARSQLTLQTVRHLLVS